MSDRHDAQGEQVGDDTRASLKRRGLIAGAAAVVAAALASKANVQEVSAQGNGTPVLLGGDAAGSGVAQSATATTWVASTPLATAPAFRATNGFADTPDPTGDGIQGFAIGASHAGIFGRNNQLNGVGSWGEAPGGTGAFGDSSSGSGVAGSSVSGAGVFGLSSSNDGVFGQSSTGNGVHGLSNGSYGVVGVTTASGFGGCTGITETAGAAAFIGGTHNASAFAAFFTGAVVVQGNFSVSGTKSAVVPHKDGSHRLVYCVESPESWFEDFGTGQLVNGKAQVSVDAEFLSLVHTTDYHVFLTEYEGHNDLYVTNRSATGFEVRAKGGGVNGSFSWRMVAKRADVQGERLAKVKMPNIKVPDVDELKVKGPKAEDLPKSRDDGKGK